MSARRPLNKVFIRALAQGALARGLFLPCASAGEALAASTTFIPPTIPGDANVSLRGNILVSAGSEDVDVDGKSVTSGDNVMYKIRFLPGDKGFFSDNSVLVEDVVYELITNPLIKNRITPHLELALGAFRCKVATFLEFGRADLATGTRDRSTSRELAALEASFGFTVKDHQGPESTQARSFDLTKLENQMSRALEQVNLNELPDCTRVDVLAVLRPRTSVSLREFLVAMIKRKQDVRKFIDILVMIVFQVCWTLAAFAEKQLMHNNLTPDSIFVDIVPEAQTFRYIVKNARKKDVVYRTKIIARIVDFENAASPKVNSLLGGNSLLRGNIVDSVTPVAATVCNVPITSARTLSREGKCAKVGACNEFNPWGDWFSFITSTVSAGAEVGANLSILEKAFLGSRLVEEASGYPDPFTLCGTPDEPGAACGAWTVEDFARAGFEPGSPPKTPTELIKEGLILDFIEGQGSNTGAHLFDLFQMDPRFSATTQIFTLDFLARFFAGVAGLNDRINPQLDSRVEFPAVL